MLLADFVRELIDSMSGIDERTRTDYHRDLDRHLFPHFGRVNLRDVAHADICDTLEVFVRTGLRYNELVALQAHDVTITRAVV